MSSTSKSSRGHGIEHSHTCRLLAASRLGPDGDDRRSGAGRGGRVSGGGAQFASRPSWHAAPGAAVVGDTFEAELAAAAAGEADAQAFEALDELVRLDMARWAQQAYASSGA